MINNEKFNEDYFENGVDKHISCYEKFRWLPNVSIPLALDIIGHAPNSLGNILDYGCAKGFLVKAFRLLNRQAYGFDISEYAIKHCDPDIKKYVSNNLHSIPNCDTVICKDVLEHCDYDSIDEVIKSIGSKCIKQALIVIPFGKEGKYRISDYDKDITHVITEDELWWKEKFCANGLKVNNFNYEMGSIKRKWVNECKNGNGFYWLMKR